MRLVLASNNPGKLRELQQGLAGCGAWQLSPQAALGVASVEETGCSFVENALIKARHAATHTGLPALADDSGLVVEALGGAPGIRSARYAGEGASDAENVQALLAAVRPLPSHQRHAQFVCVLVFLRAADDPVPIIAQGLWSGEVLGEPRGENGFGYDPVFYLPQRDCTSAELTPEEKNRTSHRALALAELLRQFSACHEDTYGRILG